MKILYICFLINADILLHQKHLYNLYRVFFFEQSFKYSAAFLYIFQVEILEKLKAATKQVYADKIFLNV